MILRIIMFIGVIAYFLWDYSKDPKRFKRIVFPIVAISFFASTDIYVRLDNRIKLILFIIVLIMTFRYALAYYNDYKIERFREKKRIRRIRDRERIERDEEILREILNVKNQEVREKSSSYEIVMDFSKKTIEQKGQINFLGIDEMPYVGDSFEYDWDELEEHEEVLENQIGMFED